MVHSLKLVYELNKIFFNDLKIRKPNYFLQSKSDTAIKTIVQGSVTRRRATLYDQNQTASISVRKKLVKSHTGESVTVRRQFTTEISGGWFSIPMVQMVYSVL